VELRVRAASLDELDRLAGETLAVGLFAEDRPPRGLAGLVDWRLNGLLSDWLVDGRFTPGGDAPLLFAGSPRLGIGRLLVVPLGRRADCGPSQVPRICERFADLLARAGTARIAAEVPAVAAPEVTAEDAVEAWLAALAVHLPRVELTLLVRSPLDGVAVRLARASGWFIREDG